MHLSEEEIRSKVVYEWLKGCGIGISQIKLEKTFHIQIGKGIKEIAHARADILVTNEQDQNLLIIEVKEPNHTLCENDKRQALSYARLLTTGIAPFTILTNGNDSHIYDSITGRLLDGQSISPQHPYVIDGFYPSGDGIETKMEALHYLITLSNENLIPLCVGQVNFHMSLLKGHDLFGGKKYIPELFVPREEIYNNLDKKINEVDVNKRTNVVLVSGPPQQGKTSFICNFVENLLEKGQPCFFYPAVRLKNGLLQEIKQDLDWLTKNCSDEFQWIERINNLVTRNNKKFIIVIDGWNEMAKDAFLINDECQRLNISGIQVVISATSFSLGNLLKDKYDNTGHIASEIKINSTQINHLRHKELNIVGNIGLVQINRFNHKESLAAIKKYAEKFDVFIPEHPLLQDPFYLRLASEQYAGKDIPLNITALGLVRNSLLAKAQRQGIDEITLFATLRALGELVIANGRSFSIYELKKNNFLDIDFQPWVDSAIIILYTLEHDVLVDFYYTHDLDFVISMICRNWQTFFLGSDDCVILDELHFSMTSEPIESALTWFLSVEEHLPILEKLFHLVQASDNAPVGVINIFAKALFNINVLENGHDQEWLAELLLKKISISLDKEEEFAVPALVFSFLETIDPIADRDQYKLWMAMLVRLDISVDEVGIDESYIIQYYGEDFRSYDGYRESTSIDVDLFYELIQSPDMIVAKRAMYVLAHACPYEILEDFSIIAGLLLRSSTQPLTILNEGAEIIDDTLGEMYYGSMCKGWLTDSKPDVEFEDEYEKQIVLLIPIIKMLSSYPVAERLNSKLLDLKQLSPKHTENLPENFPDFPDPNQLGLEL